jgi:hypothetical protein
VKFTKSWHILVRVAAVTALSISAQATWAHCDALDGPVIADARAAFAKSDPTPVLKWVAKDREGEIREAFSQSLAARAGSEAAKAVADRWFFETLVRIHREGEGEAFTGLKPAGRTDPGIAAADQALVSGKGSELGRRLAAEVDEAIRKRYAQALERRKQAGASVEAGREYVEAYVDYIHFVESIHRLLSEGASPKHHEEVSDVDR